MIILAILTGTSGSYLFYLVQKENARILKATGESKYLTTREEKILSQKNLLKDTEDRRKKLVSYTLDKDEEVDFIERVEKIARDNGINADVQASEERFFKDKKDKDGAMALKLSISYAGSWSNAFRFLLLLENIPYKKTWSALSLEKISGGQLTDKVSFAKKPLVNNTEWRGNFVFSIAH